VEEIVENTTVKGSSGEANDSGRDDGMAVGKALEERQVEASNAGGERGGGKGCAAPIGSQLQKCGTAWNDR
jgi:hypothetical protein